MTEQHLDHPRHDDHDDFGGLRRDLPALISRRRALAWLGGAGAAGLLAACGGSESNGSAATAAPSTTAPSTPASATDASATDGSVASVGVGDEIPQETAGPYPADGSNGPNVLGEDGVVRSDITSSTGAMSGTADGAPTTIRMTVVDAHSGTARAGAAVYLWHCTAGGQYSIYEVTDQNYLRGVQEADANGIVEFTTIFPGCYAGRWPHCHFEVYDALADATAGSSATTTSQLALPQDACEEIYADSRYGSSASNLGRLSLDTDNVFGDGWEDQLATVTADGDARVVELVVRT